MIFNSIINTEKEKIREFDCGIPELNLFLKSHAAQNDKKNIGKTFTLVGDNNLIGYYTLSSAQIEFEELDDELRYRLPRYPIPAIRIARLAIDSTYQKQGYGSILLKDAFLRIIKVSKDSGVCFIIVDAKEVSKGFYEHYGFIKLDSYESTYLLSLNTLIKAVM